MGINYKITVFTDKSLSRGLRGKIDEMLKEIFSDVDDREAREDFINPKVAHVLAFVGEELVGWAGLHLAGVEYMSNALKLGGFGIGVREDMRRRGIGAQICRVAMEWLEDKGVEVAFLSARPESTKLFEKFGFVPMRQNYSWENVHGEIKTGDDGMIAPVGSRELFELIRKGKKVLHVGRGYW